MQSRHEVGHILRASGVDTIEFRASMVIGGGSLSFELLRARTNRLPVMLCPRWLSTPTQPIAIDDAVAFLLAAQTLPPGAPRRFEIGGPDVVTYRDMIQEYARQRGLRRWLIAVPCLTPYLSGLWLALVTPTRYEVGRHLIEGLKSTGGPGYDRAGRVPSASARHPTGHCEGCGRRPRRREGPQQRRGQSLTGVDNFCEALLSAGVEKLPGPPHQSATSH